MPNMNSAERHAEPRGGEIVVDRDAREPLATRLGLGALARAHEDGPCAHRTRRLYDAQRVAARRHGGEIGLQARGDVEQETGIGLATQTVIVGAVRTDKDRIYRTTVHGLRAMQLVVYTQQRVHV